MSASTTKLCFPQCSSSVSWRTASCGPRHGALHQLIFQHQDAQGPQFPVVLGDVLPAYQPCPVALAFEPLHQLVQIGVQVLFIFLERHSIHPAGGLFPQQFEACPQCLLVQMSIQVTEPVVPVCLSLVCYCPQESWPALSGRSYRAGCLCRLRCSVAPFAVVGACALPAATMKRSDSRLSLGLPFLSSSIPSRLALVVSAAGDYRVSLVP